MEMDWELVDVARLTRLSCPMCGRGLAGGLLRQVEWSPQRCVVVVGCPNCNNESMAVLDSRPMRGWIPPLDVDDVRAAHEILQHREWRVDDLFVH